MRRFIITSDNFSGNAELVYNDADVLVKIDCTQTNITGALMHAFKKLVPEVVQLIEAAFAPTKCTVIEADFEVTFEMFWLKYNKKINKKRCEPKWNKLTKTKQVQAFYGIDAYDKFLQRTGWRNKVDPENYLADESWENEWK